MVIFMSFLEHFGIELLDPNRGQRPGSEDSAGGVLGGGLGGLGERERGETAIEMGIWERLQSMGFFMGFIYMGLVLYIYEFR